MGGWEGESAMYWLRLPWNWGRQVLRNGSDILRVLDILRLRPLPAGLVSEEHPWVTGLNPATGIPVWFDNVIYRSPRTDAESLATDEQVLLANGRFLALRVRQSAVLPEVPQGAGRRMPHCINYMHGSSHYNSGLILLNDIADAYRHVNDGRFRLELCRFVCEERREVLFLLRSREYESRDLAELSCCMRSHFHWFCNPNGPRASVLWGNKAPFPALNLITGHWADDVYSLKRAGGAERVVRPAIERGRYFVNFGLAAGRSRAIFPERLLAWVNHQRVRLRGRRGGMFFVDRRSVYADEIERRVSRGLPEEDRARTWGRGDAGSSIAACD